MRKNFVFTYSEADFTQVCHRTTYCIVNGFGKTQSLGAGIECWRGLIQGSENSSKPWLDILADRRRQKNVLKQVFSIEEYFLKQDKVEIRLNSDFGYLLLAPNGKDSEVSMPYAVKRPDFWFYEWVFNPILKELEKGGLGHFEIVPDPMPAVEAVALDQDSLGFLGKPSHCWF